MGALLVERGVTPNGLAIVYDQLASTYNEAGLLVEEHRTLRDPVSGYFPSPPSRSQRTYDDRGRITSFAVDRGDDGVLDEVSTVEYEDLDEDTYIATTEQDDLTNGVSVDLEAVATFTRLAKGTEHVRVDRRLDEPVGDAVELRVTYLYDERFPAARFPAGYDADFDDDGVTDESQRIEYDEGGNKLFVVIEGDGLTAGGGTATYDYSCH